MSPFMPGKASEGNVKNSTKKVKDKGLPPGTCPCDPGWFLHPTLLLKLNKASNLVHRQLLVINSDILIPTNNIKFWNTLWVNGAIPENFSMWGMCWILSITVWVCSYQTKKYFLGGYLHEHIKYQWKTDNKKNNYVRNKYNTKWGKVYPKERNLLNHCFHFTLKILIQKR